MTHRAIAFLRGTSLKINALICILVAAAIPAIALSQATQPRSPDKVSQKTVIPPQTPAKTAPLNNKNILSMVKAGLSSEIIIAKIKSSACDFDTSPTALTESKKAGVSDAIILAMVQAPTANLRSVVPTSASPVAPPASTPTGITGSVFAITNAGDVKPARLARIQLVEYGQETEADEISHAISTAAADIQDLRTQATQARSGSISGTGPLFDTDGMVESLCVRYLVHFRSPTPDDGRTDESGVFSLAVKPDKYLIMVSGRAGSNVALWVSKVRVQANEMVTIKMNQPSLWCSDPGGKVTF